MKKPTQSHHKQSGAGMIEVLVTLIIVLVGLLGLAGMMVLGQRSEIESYQRVQALILLQDMVGRINTNRKVAGCYAITTDTANGAPFLGTSSSISVPTCTSGTTEQNLRAIQDIQDWHALLTGAAETNQSASLAGAMVGARGCISFDATAGVYQVSVAWQGMGDTSAPPVGQVCGKDQYTDEKQRRTVSVTLQIANLT